MSSTLRSLTELWLTKIRIAERVKEDQFGRDARMAMKFYNGPHDFIYAGDGDGGSSMGFFAGITASLPAFRMTVNKVAELVQLFLPWLYHRNPIRQVTPRRCQLDPALLFSLGIQPDYSIQQRDDIRASLVQHYLNSTPPVLNLRENSRLAIVEALIKGRGVLWTEFYELNGSRMIGSFYDSVDYLLIDPDAEMVREAQWIARGPRREPAWALEKKLGLPKDSLKPNAESRNRQAEIDSSVDGDYHRKTGASNDLIEYYEVYSRMGIGGRLQGSDKETRDALEQFGDAAYLIIAPGIDYPLNLPPDIASQADLPAQIGQRVAWPTPFHRDRMNPWPFTELDFHSIPKKPWPMSHIYPVMGYQKFLDWAYSHLAGKVHTTCRDLLAYPEDMESTVTEALSSAGDLALIPYSAARWIKIQEALQWIQAPPMNQDILTILQAVEIAFEKGSGMSELMYGQQRSQDRSATATKAKQSSMSVRPDYMAECVENWMSHAARKEGLAARHHLEAQDVAPHYGELESLAQGMMGAYTMLWMNLVRQDDFAMNVAELEYRIEAGSSRKPNKDREIANIDESAQILVPQLMQVYQMTGDPTAINNWLRMWAESRDMDPGKVQLPPLQPPAPMGPQLAQTSEGQVA